MSVFMFNLSLFLHAIYSYFVIIFIHASIFIVSSWNYMSTLIRVIKVSALEYEISTVCFSWYLKPLNVVRREI